MSSLGSDSHSPGDQKSPASIDDDDDVEEKIRPRDLGHIARFLRPFVQPYQRTLVVIVGLLLVQTAFDASFPLATRYLIDEGLIERDWDALVFILSYLAVAAVAVMAVAIANDFIYSRMFAHVIKDIRFSLFGHIQRLPIAYFQRKSSGQVLSRFSGDVVATETMLVEVIPCLVVPVMEVAYATILMFYFNIWLALIGLLVFPMILIGPHFFSKRAFDLSYDKRAREAEMLSAVQENIQAQPVVKAFGLGRRSVNRFGRLGRAWSYFAYRINVYSALTESSAYMGIYVLHMVIIGLGAYWAYTGEMTIGTLIAFEDMFISMGYALTEITQFVPTLAQAHGSVQHLDEVFSEKPSVTDADDARLLPRMRRSMAFDGVSFAYPGGRNALTNVTFEIPNNAYIAIVGRSGSGKSTIVNLLLRFYDPSAGRVVVDGIDVRTVTQDSLRTQMGIVFQDSFLFNASILENVRMGKPDATGEEVEAALRAAEFWDAVPTLRKGLRTRVGERGGKLSGGQRQRIAIARALVRSPAILILDEATSALDAVAEAAIIATIQRIARTHTVVNITHRLSNVVGADHILVLEDGRIVEAGRHRELLARGGHYAMLWRTQKESELREAAQTSERL